MNVLSVAYVVTAAVCVVVALQHVAIGLRVRDRTIELLFAVAALAVAGDAVFGRRIYAALTPEEFLAAMPWTALFISTTIVALSLYIAVRTGLVRRWLLITVAVLAALTVILDFAVGIAYTGPVKIDRLELPWGEEISLAVGATSPLRVVGDSVLLVFLLLLLDTTVRLVRRGDRRAARLIGGSLVVYCLALFMIIPVDLGWLRLPSLHTFAFLIIVAAMSWSLTDELVRASRLSREVIANERRWRQLLERVQLLAVQVDTDGRIVWANPFAVETSGYTRDELIGRRIGESVPEDARDEALAVFARNLEGGGPPEVERQIITRDGTRHHVVWRTVTLFDSDGRVEGVLSLGADVTDRRAAEASLESALRQVEELKGKLEEENIYLREEIQSEHGFEGIVGDSNPLLYVLHKVRQVASSDATVLIQGETGVGKELIARAIHRESPRAGRPFIKVNCAALPASLIESELFGHERGAFTGADRRRIGRFELADGGTLFLDEVGELPLEVQPKLLRALQDGELERVGGTETLSVDVRVVAATNRDLRAEMEGGRFREDLFYRLEVYPVTVPPLRDRSEDIPMLVQHFVGQIGARHGAQIDEVPSTVMRLLQDYSWPGNVRELQNVIERAILVSRQGVLRLADPLEERGNDEAPTPVRGVEDRFRSLNDVERDHIAEVLESVNGQISGSGGAAEILGLHPNTLRYRMKKLGIKAGRKTSANTADS